MNPQKKTAVVTGAAGFPGGPLSDELLQVGGTGREIKSSGGGRSCEFVHRAVCKVPQPGAALGGGLADWGALLSFAGGFSRVEVYFRDFLRIPA